MARRRAASSSSSSTTCCPTTTGSSRRSAALAAELGLPVVVTNDVHYARPEDRELHDVLTAIRHGRTLDTLADLRRPDGESYLKSGDELAALPPGDAVDRGATCAGPGRRASPTPVELAASLLGRPRASSSTASRASRCRTGRRRSPTSSELCRAGARRRYHPLTSAVVKRLAHELDVIERAGLAEFFLICWDLMRFAKEQGIPAQGRGSATSSIVAYTLGISRVEPIRHNLLFERFINEGRTTYPDVDIDFSSERREEVIQYVYERYGPEHTGMVCNLVTYRARSAVREVGYALGFPRPLVDRVAKALETYDSVMVRRDLEADGGFAEFFRRPGEGTAGRGARGRGRRGARPRRRDGPAEHADPARREGAALAPAAEAGGPGRAATVRLAPARPRRSAAAGRRRLPRIGLARRIGRRRSGLADAHRRRGRPRRHAGERRLAAGRDAGRAIAGRIAERLACRAGARSTAGGSTRRAASSSRRRATDGPIDWAGRADGLAAHRGPRRSAATARDRSSVARIEPEPPPQARGGSTVGLSDWERWLEFCARIDGFPRHLRSTAAACS